MNQNSDIHPFVQQSTLPVYLGTFMTTQATSKLDTALAVLSKQCKIRNQLEGVRDVELAISELYSLRKELEDANAKLKEFELRSIENEVYFSDGGGWRVIKSVDLWMYEDNNWQIRQVTPIPKLEVK